MSRPRAGAAPDLSGATSGLNALPTVRVAELSPEDVRSQARAWRQRPQLSELVDAFGDAGLRVGEHRWKMKIQGRRQVQALAEMMDPSMRAETLAHRELDARVPKERLRLPTGETIEVRAQDARFAARNRRARPLRHYGRGRLVARIVGGRFERVA